MLLDTSIWKEEVDAALRSVLDNLFQWVAAVRDTKFCRVVLK